MQKARLFDIWGESLSQKFFSGILLLGWLLDLSNYFFVFEIKCLFLGEKLSNLSFDD